MYVIRFRDGRYYKDVNQHEDDFVKLEDACKFETEGAADGFMRKFFWMAFAGAHVLEVEPEETGPRWGIEFRNGGWFQGLTMEYSGPAQHAHKFRTKEETEDMLKAHAWLMFAGGMVKEIK